MHRTGQSLLLLTIALTGCGPGARPPSSDPATAARSQSPWADQLAAVRDGRSRQIAVADGPVTAAQFAELADGCAILEVLDLDHVEITADDLAVLARLSNLNRIKLGAPIDDAGLQHLNGATGLVSLNLPQATFTDRGLEHLANLPHLELLRFRSPHVTDAGLKHIAALPAMRFLHLIDVPVTDAGIAHLHSMSKLESFYLDGGRCTDDGLRSLLKALPNLHFHLDQLHLPGDPRADDHGAPPPPKRPN